MGWVGSQNPATVTPEGARECYVVIESLDLPDLKETDGGVGLLGCTVSSNLNATAFALD
jgi:hypothetical protein